MSDEPNRGAPGCNAPNPTVRWLVHGAWRIALTTVIVLLLLGLLFDVILD